MTASQFQHAPALSDPTGPEVERVFTTNPGLEQVVRGEFRQRCYEAAAPRGTYNAAKAGVRGRVIAHAPEPVMAWAVPRMRSIHHVLRPVHRFQLGADDGPEAIAAVVGTLDIPEMAGATSFRITTNRRGDQGYTSEDVMRAAGAAVNARWGTPVDLEGFDVELRVDVIEDLCTVAVARTRQPLSNRHPRAETHPAALRANIAFAALRLAQLDGAGRLLDPFCGSGTVLLEAGAVWPQLELVGCDWHERAAAGAHANLAAAGLAERARVEQRDSLAGLADLGGFDAVVTNPPYGRKLGRAMNFPDFYRRIFTATAPLLDSGQRLILLADRGGAVNRGLRAAGGFRIRRRRLLQMSGVWPSIYVFERD